MSTCIVYGSGENRKIRQIGNNRSHANNATKRPFRVNIQRKRYTLSSGKVVQVYISAKGIKTVDKKGVEFLESLLNGENNG